MRAADLIDDDDDDEYHQVHADLELPYSRCVAIAEEAALPFARDGVTIGITESPTYPFVELRMHRQVGELQRTKRTSVSRHTTPDDFRRQCDGAWKFLEQQHQRSERLMEKCDARHDG